MPDKQFKNEVHVSGELVKDPEIRNTSTGKSVCHLTVITKFKNWSEFHKLVCWEALAEKCSGLRKGDFIRCVGRLATRFWDDKQSGQKKYSTEIVCWQVATGNEPVTTGVSDENESVPF